MYDNGIGMPDHLWLSSACAQVNHGINVHNTSQIIINYVGKLEAK